MQTEKIIQHIVSWLKDYIETSHQKGFVIGISGGIDSAVTSTLCAMTGYPLLNLEMPIHQEANQADRAKKHIEWLKDNFNSPIDSIEVDLTSTFDDLVSALPTIEKTDKVNLALANTRARLRMTTLYYFAGLNNYLVAGTGNKVEDFGVGFYTKYGDGGVDLSPIADLMKSEVYTIAKYLGINTAIQKAKPTDGLFGDDRSDEDQLGASYDELEWAMQMKEEGHDLDEFEGRQKVVFEIYSRLNRINQHKMIPIPLCKIPEEYKD
ncbi:NAD(+) synthase [Faecalibacter rhinopitheci]|uniref:NH(3)-dependent NAD(+) synthetase n=1 Tax=Faecalibacter rhinopitheci TaxID=2779678 RepID=A0A8J7FRB5_9FLAO|nr:NAD(+) synthase [Faecalibacter rhinopitheci]MBF0597043.1 NAD(+) synthase [Faecalibacter rhinopitheci]